MFGLFDTEVIFNKQVKVVDFSTLDRIVTVKLSNKKDSKSQCDRYQSRAVFRSTDLS